jgi:ATP-dependent DNA helicase RecG
VVVEAKGANGPHMAYGRAYLRVGESDKAMSAHELEIRMQNKKKFHWENEISRKTLADVNEGVVKDFMRKAKEAKRIDFDFVDVKTTLNKLGLLDRGDLTRAAEVLFCDESSMEVQAAIFAGTDKLTFLDIKSFKGTLFSLRQQAEIYVKEHMKWRAVITSGPREEIPEIPVDALREAIGNSLCHRDFSNPKGNEVAIFKDRVEIYNPGFFPDGVNPEDFFTGHEHSILRNPLIAETMYKSKDFERWGSGIKRIYDECVSAGVRVEFRKLKTGFVVMFYRPKWEEGEGLGQDHGGKSKVKSNEKSKVKSNEKVIRLIVSNSAITVPEIAESLGLSLAGVEKIIRTLKQRERLRRVGPDKGGHWEVLG